MKFTRLVVGVIAVVLGAIGLIASSRATGYGLLGGGVILVILAVVPGSRPLLGVHGRMAAIVGAVVTSVLAIAGVSGLIRIEARTLAGLVFASLGLIYMAAQIGRDGVPKARAGG
jgi:hypothetical protein